MPTTRRTRLIIALLAATFGAFTVPFVLALVSPPLHHPPLVDTNNPAYQLAASDQAATPTYQQLATYQQAVTGITVRCPQLDDIIIRVTQTRQALHDQARRDVSALNVLNGVDHLLEAHLAVEQCSGVFVRYLLEAAR